MAARLVVFGLCCLFGSAAGWSFLYAGHGRAAGVLAGAAVVLFAGLVRGRGYAALVLVLGGCVAVLAVGGRPGRAVAGGGAGGLGAAWADLSGYVGAVLR